MIKYGTILCKCKICGETIEENDKELTKTSALDSHTHDWEEITKEDSDETL